MKHWTENILEFYWDMRPCQETQELYKRMGLSAFEYWKYEIMYLTESTWRRDECLPKYILDKYTGEKIQLDKDDKKVLRRAFIIDLGMIPDCFPY